VGKKSEKREQRVAAAKSREFRRVIAALTMAAPFCLGLRFPDLKSCIAASVCGAQALARWQIQARAIPCVAIATHRASGLQLTTGLTRRQQYDRLGVTSSYEEWEQLNEARLPPKGLNTHAIIQASSGHECAFIDLTAGQLRNPHLPHTMTIPWQIVRADERPFESETWIVVYEKLPFDPEVHALISGFSNIRFVDDLHALMRLALHCELDQKSFRLEFQRQEPESYNIAMSYITRLGGID
jgi:hypothetical protein